MVSCAENGVALWGPRPRDSVLPMCEQLSERAGGDEVSLALQLLPSAPLTRPLSHLWCPCLWCWSQTVLDPATQRSDHRWVTLHLRTCFLSCGMWDHLHRAVVHTWDDARKVQSWVVAIIGAEQSFCIWGLSPSPSPSAWAWPVDSQPCEQTVIEFGSREPVPLGLRLHNPVTQTSMPWPLFPQALSRFQLPYQKWHSSFWPAAISPGPKPSQPRHTFVTRFLPRFTLDLLTQAPLHTRTVTWWSPLFGTMLLMYFAHLSCGCTCKVSPTHVLCCVKKAIWWNEVLI